MSEPESVGSILDKMMMLSAEQYDVVRRCRVALDKLDQAERAAYNLQRQLIDVLDEILKEIRRTEEVKR